MICLYYRKSKRHQWEAEGRCKDTLDYQRRLRFLKRDIEESKRFGAGSEIAWRDEIYGPFAPTYKCNDDNMTVVYTKPADDVYCKCPSPYWMSDSEGSWVCDKCAGYHE